MPEPDDPKFQSFLQAMTEKRGDRPRTPKGCGCPLMLVAILATLCALSLSVFGLRRNPPQPMRLLAVMQTALQLHGRTSPATRPHPLAYHGGALWMGSWDTDSVYAIDPQTWSVREEFAAPGKPYGIAALSDELRVVIALGEDDDRYLYRLLPGKGFDLDSKTACPDFTGSYIAANGSTLYLGQMHNRRILALDAHGAVQREIAMPTHFAGLAFGPGGRFYMISGDDELEHLKFGTLDIAQNEPAFEELATIPDQARSLAYDGTQWWTCLRDANEIASFTM